MWPPERLSHRLEGPVCETLVFERNGRVQGLVNYNCFFMQGRERVLAAMIALWADDGLTGMQLPVISRPHVQPICARAGCTCWSRSAPQ